jgi:ketosteroid isomerase-like protein
VPEWLFEGQLVVYFVLAVGAVLCGWLWWGSRRSGPLIGLAVCVALIAIYFLLDRLIETDREQISHNLQTMVDAVATRDVNRIFSFVSEDYQRGSANKATFRNDVERLINGGVVSEVVIWDVTFPRDYAKKANPEDARATLATVSFRAKPRSPQGTTIDYRVEGQMKRDSDGRWRLIGFKAFDAYKDSAQEIVVPQMGP